MTKLQESRQLGRGLRCRWPAHDAVQRGQVRLPPESDREADSAGRSVPCLVSRVSPVHTAMRNCTRDEGRPFEVGNQVLISSHRKLLRSKSTVVNVAEKSEQDFGRHG